MSTGIHRVAACILLSVVGVHCGAHRQGGAGSAPQDPYPGAPYPAPKPPPPPHDSQEQPAQRPPTALPPFPEPQCLALQACIARFGKPMMSPQEVRAAVEGANAECLPRMDPGRLLARACEPLSLGVDAGNGRPVQLIHHCSDVCAPTSRFVAVYPGVAQADCCAAGGYPEIEAAFHSYIGCAPRETMRERLTHRTPDGREVFSDPCARPAAGR